MTPAATVFLGFGLFFLAMGGWISGKTEHFIRSLKAFPRNRPAGMVFSVVSIAWATGIFLTTPDEVLGFFARLKPPMYVLAPVVIYGLIFHLDDLLAPRMLGCFFVLLGEPILEAIRWHPSPLRFLVTVAVYIGVIKSIILVLYPYKFRDWTRWLLAQPGRAKALAMVALVYGAACLVLAFTVFRAPV